jgi:putative cell wall-binding protein
MTYTGEAQELVTAGKAENGTVKYAIGTDAATAPTGEYSADVPTKTDAGTYYVWYKVVGDENYNDTEPKCVTATIDKADQSPSAKTLTYTAKPQELVNPGKALTGKMLYAVNTDPSAAPTEGYSEDVPTETNAGQYYVWFKLTGNGNYKDSTPICIPVEIKKIDATVKADNITKNCGREDPELTYTAKGLLEGDTLTGALAREAGETAGKYKITQGTLTNENYNITFTGAEFTIEATQVNRLAGANRYETAIAISSDNFEKADTVILTNAQNYADGIAGVPLASKLNAPILLTAADKLNDKTLEEIKRLGAKNVIILGGESAVSADVAKALEDENYVVERLEGKSRFSTAAAIAQKVNENPTDIFFVYGMGFADTLSVSSVAALKNAPIIYLTTDGELNADTAAYLAQLKEKGCVKNAYVIGGTSVISDDMMNKAAQALGLESATRIAGANRYETSAEVNKAFADLFENDEMCVATGVDFPDAVTGGVYAASKKAPFILVSSALTDSQKEIVKNTAPKTINVFGGTGAVSDETVKAMIDTLAQPQEEQAPSEEISEKE